MGTITAISENDAVAAMIRRSFPLHGPLQRLAGGEGRTYRAGDIIYRHEARIPEAAYIAEIYAALPVRGFRIPHPIRSLHGSWVSADGWSAWSFVRGRAATKDDVPSVLPALHAFHTALASFPYPPILTTKDTPYTRADAAAWGDLPADLDGPFVPFATHLAALRRPISDRPAQLIHGDLNDENILISADAAPAIIDFTPCWRPPAYALAVFAYWIGPYRGEYAILDLFATIPAFDQLLIRVALSKLCVKYEFNKLGHPLTNIAAEFQTPVTIIVDWIQRQQR
jgi:uncharacterized protein (TIGR02569 family)